MKFSDVITLAKQGFTPADIREFLKLETEPEKEKPAEDPQQEPEKEKPAEDPQQEPEKEKPAEDPQQEPEEEQPTEEPQLDYKKMYEAEKAKRQAAARKQEVAVDPDKSVKDTLLDIAKMYI